jgi:ubiquinone/menaquinone biosynthesis C-methylase UbiE
MPVALKMNPSWRGMLAFLNWILNPFQRLTTVQVYELLSTQWRTQRTLYLNLGYWETARDLEEACQAMAALLADTVEMGHRDRVLDVGFGFADQNIFWAEAYQPAAIIGLNITPLQVEIARKRVADRQLAHRIDLRRGSATQMPLEAESVEVVTALECAFHFHTRERFFQEAYRVLCPGGRLVTADILPMPPEQRMLKRLWQRISWRLPAGKFVIPQTNWYDRREYARLLGACGFHNVQVKSIREQVYLPMHRYLANHPEPLAGLHPAVRTVLRWALKMDATFLYQGLDYVLASARKP